jgi:signal transduction histidine kinase
LAQRYHVTIDRDIPADLPHLMIDPPLLRRVLINLLDNALRHTPERGRVLVQAQFVSSSTVLIRVADSGPGLPPEERERVFEKFKQAKKNQARGRGMGLGLTFCRLVIEAHGGRIWVEDHSPLPGASFAFTLIGAQRNPS